MLFTQIVHMSLISGREKKLAKVGVSTISLSSKEEDNDDKKM